MFKAHGRVYHSTLGSRVMKMQKKSAISLDGQKSPPSPLPSDEATTYDSKDF